MYIDDLIKFVPGRMFSLASQKPQLEELFVYREFVVWSFGFSRTLHNERKTFAAGAVLGCSYWRERETAVKRMINIKLWFKRLDFGTLKEVLLHIFSDGSLCMVMDRWPINVSLTRMIPLSVVLFWARFALRPYEKQQYLGWMTIVLNKLPSVKKLTLQPCTFCIPSSIQR